MIIKIGVKGLPTADHETVGQDHERSQLTPQTYLYVLMLKLMFQNYVTFCIINVYKYQFTAVCE